MLSRSPPRRRQYLRPSAEISAHSTEALLAPRGSTAPPPPSPEEQSRPPASLRDVFSGILAAPSRRPVPRRRSPPRGHRRPQPKATRSIADMLRAHPPRSTAGDATGSSSQPVADAPSAPSAPQPTRLSGGSLAGQARKRPSPLWLVPLGCRAKHMRGACRGGHGRLNCTRPTSPPLCLFFYHQADAER